MLLSSHLKGLTGYFHQSGRFFYTLTDLKGYYIYVNPFFQQTFRHISADLYGMPASGSFIYADADKYKAAVEQCLQNPGQVIQADLQARREDDSFTLIRWEISAGVDAAGNPENIQAIGFAVDELTDVLKGLTEQIEKLPERYKAYEQSAEGIWRLELGVPVPVTASPEMIIAHCRQHAFLAECNDNMARMYGFEKSTELTGAGPDDLMDFDDPVRIEYLKKFIRNGFFADKVETKEHDRYGNIRYFLNNMKGVVENGLLKRIWGTQHDITEQRLAEQQLKQSELFYRNLIADSQDGVVLTDEKGVISFASPSVTKVLGYSTEESIGKNIFEYVYPEDHQLAVIAFEAEVNLSPKVKFVNIRLRKKTGEWIWCIVRGHNMLYNPYVARIVIYFYDDTKRKEIENKLKEREEYFRSIIQNLRQGVIVQNEKNEVIVCNQAALDMLGLSEDKLMGPTSFNTSWNIIHEDGRDFPADTHPVSVAIGTKKSVRDVVMGVYRPASNDRVWLLVNAEPLLDKNGDLTNVICSFTDITEQKQLSQKLIDQEIQKQRQLTQATIDGQEKERQQVGKELHDNINQHLTTTRLYMEVAREKASGETLEMINLSHKTLAEIINEIRHLSQSLVPPTLGDLGLIESIHDLCDSLRRAHTLVIDFSCRHFNEEELPGNLKLMLFRIIQEQVNNIIRHAGADAIQIKIQSDAEYIILAISDNGKGFDLAHYKKGLGFSNIDNRASLFNGRVEIEAATGKGCTLMVTIPLVTG